MVLIYNVKYLIFSINSSAAAGESPKAGASLAEALDHRVDAIIKEWHHNSDLLFAIHPIDGSLLVWVADFLDEYQPGAFRQAQVIQPLFVIFNVDRKNIMK